MDSFRFSMVLASGVAAWTYYLNLDDLLNKNKKNNDLYLLKNSKIDKYLSYVNEVNNLKVIMIDIEDALVCTELIKNYMTDYYNIFFKFDECILTFNNLDQISSKYDLLIDIKKQIDNLDTISENKVNNKPMFDGNYKLDVRVGIECTNVIYKMYEVKIASLFIRDIVLKMAEAGTINYKDINNNKKPEILEIIPEGDSKYKDTFYKLRSYRDQYFKDKPGLSISDEDLALMLIIFENYFPLYKEIEYYLKKLDNDIESLNVARTSNDTYINRLQHKIDLFEHNDLFVKYYLKNNKKTFLAID